MNILYSFNLCNTWDVSVLERISSGIPGLDSLLGGGLPKGRIFLVIGNPGAGKTIFGMQFLYNGAVEHGEPGLYVSLEESATHLKEEMLELGWDVEELEDQGLITIIDASPIRSIPGDIHLGEIKVGKREFSLLSLNQIIRVKARTTKALRIVIDPLSTLILQFNESFERRRAILDLFQSLSELGATCIVTSELEANVSDRKSQLEEFLAQGVIALYSLSTGGKAAQLIKVRGVAHDTNLRPYQISEKGISIFSDERVFL